MLKLREPFSQKVHLHIRQDMLQRLWDKYVPTSSPEYEQIELVYLKDALGDMEKQPEQIQLLLHLILKNKKMQINLMQYPALVKIGNKQMESSLQRMERYYTAQLKCLDLTMYRTVRQYFTLLEQASEDVGRYQGWQKTHQEIEKQKDEYRLLSLFSEKLRDYLTDYSVNTLRTMEREFVDSLSDTEYRMLAEELIWQEKPELTAYFKESEKAWCKKIVKKLEKDTHMNQVLSSTKKQSAKKKLVAAVHELEQKEFSLFYWQVVNLKDVNPQMVIWKENRTEMFRSIDEMETESLQKVWAQMETVGSVKRNEHVFTEKILHLQNQYQQNESRNLRKQIDVMLEENALEDIVDIEQLIQDISIVEHTEKLADDISIVEYTEKPADDISIVEHTEKSADDTEEPEHGSGESEHLVLWHGAYQVLRNLEREQEIRRERIEQQQVQAVEIYQDAYRQMLRTEYIPFQQQEDIAQTAERIFHKQYQEQLTEEEIRNISEYCQAFLEVYFAEQGQAEGQKEILSSSDQEEQREILSSSDQEEQPELTYVVEQINHHIEEQHGSEERLILHWQEDLSKDERIKKLLIYIRELEEEQRDQFIYYLADMFQLSVQLSSQRKVSAVMQSDRMASAEFPIQSNKQESAKKMLRIEDREFAKRLLQVEDREFAERLLQVEDREFAEKLLQVEDRELARRLLQIGNREFVEKLLQIANEESTGELLQNDDGQLSDVSYKNLWEWGETLLFHPEHQQEWEDADILSVPQQETFPSDKAKQEDAQTQMIRRQIEVAKDRNRLQSLFRQINHQADMQLVYTDAQLRLPQVQNLLHYIQQVDEKQYGVLVKKLAQNIKIQKLIHEESQAASVANEYESAGEWLRIEDKEFIEKLLQVENKEFAERLLQVENREFAEKLLQIENREFAEKLLQIENREFAEKLLQIENREFAERLLQVENREFAEKLLQIENREFAEKLLQIENREFAEKLLQIENKEFAERLLQVENREFAERLLQVENREFAEELLQNNDGQMSDVSYKNLWEWGEALLLYPEYQPEQETADIISGPQQETVFSDETQQEDEQTRIIHRQTEIERGRNHLQSLISLINHQADVQLVYTDAQLRVPQIQDLLKYIQQLDVGQYETFVKELAQVTMVQRISYDEPGETAHTVEKHNLPGTRAVSLEQGRISYPILVRYIHNYEKQHQSELYRDIRKIEQKIFLQDYEKEDQNQEYITDSSEAGNYVQLTIHERNHRENGYQSQELEYSVQTAPASEEEQQRKELLMQQENARIKSTQEQLDKKLKEVEHQLKKVEDSTKAKEDVRGFAEQVKQQLYEELHVEKLRRGLI